MIELDRVHCNNCNAEVGYKPPFFVGDSTWYVLDVFGEHYDYCEKCKPIIEKKIKQILIPNTIEGCDKS